MMRRLALVALLSVAACDAGARSSPAILPRIHKTAGGQEMVLLPAGEFLMGSSRGHGDEAPAHKVKVDSFLIDRTEVTQEMYEKLKLPNPSKVKGANLPVHMMSWAFAARYCNERSKAEGLEECYNDQAECDFSRNGYRLPTEAEWEYACRAGSTGDYPFGGDPRKLQEHAWTAENSREKPHPVAQKTPNAWGLYDMLGNIAEWCNDMYDKEYYKKSPSENPRGPAEARQYVVRGGSYKSSAALVRSPARSADNPGFSDACLAPETLGFRCVRKAPSTSPKSGYLQDRARTGLVYEEIYLEHKTGQGFPERPARIEAIFNRLKEKGLVEKMERIRPIASPQEWITQVHPPEYVARLKSACEGLGDRVARFQNIGDNPMSARTYDAAIAAAGGVLGAVDAVMEGRARNAFCAIRPPGHHARKDEARGFCFLNNVAIAARYIQKKHKLAKVLIVDWDVHHGDGTQITFNSDGSVLYFSTHLSPFYPGTGSAEEKGEGKAAGLIINVPLKVGEGDREVLQAYEEKLKPAALAFNPDFVLVSCGFDSHVNDTLGRLAITTEGFGRMTKVVREIAEKHAKGRLISMLEGGYNLDNLANAAEAHVRVLME